MAAERGVLAVGDEREVVVGPVAHGGHFIAHSDGRTLFVRHTLPGERVRVRVTEVTSRIVRADAIEVLDPSPDHVPAPCPWAGAGLCGGCDFQHVSLDAQRRLKTQVLRESLQRFGGIAADDPVLSVEVAELPGAPDGLRWRTRMTWATALDGSRGLRRHRSHDVVAVDDCLIAEVDVSRPDAPPRGKVARSVRDRTWRIGDGDFWQVHPALPEALVESVLEFGRPRPAQVWWDLYAGAGLFSAFLGEAVGPDGSVEAVETSFVALRTARRALHDLPNVHLHGAEVGAWLSATHGARPDGVVLDPPRAGAGAKIVDAIAQAGRPTVVYVACDPIALARDIALFAAHSYRLGALRAFDAFPLTHHFETVALLSPMSA
jgi:tRNA/tmRNA/rRNA uracil-C5-methylase (TrmA/RlmC/RlmD family)